MAGAALALAVEERRAGLGVAGQDVLRLEDRRAAQRVVDALPQEVREVDDLRVGQRDAARRSAIGCPFFRNGPSSLP